MAGLFKTLEFLSAFLLRNLGHCSACIRKAFLAAAYAWGLVLLVAVCEWSELLLFVLIGAIGITTLWLAHVLVFARKVIVANDVGSVHPATHSRRAILPLFARALALGALLSAAPRRAFADGACGTDGCGPCYRPLTARDGTVVCQACHSCADSQGRFNCGGGTC